MLSVRLLPVLALVLLAGCASSQVDEPRVVVYGQDAFRVENAPANWSYEEALTPISNGRVSILQKSRTVQDNREQKRVSLVEHAFVDRGGNEVSVITFYPEEGDGVSFVSTQKGEPLDVINAMIDSFEMTEDERSAASLAAFEAWDEGAEHPTLRLNQLLR